MTFRLGARFLNNDNLLFIVPDGINAFSVFNAFCISVRVDPITLLMNKKVFDNMWVVQNEEMEITMPNLDIDPESTLSIIVRTKNNEYNKDIEKLTELIRKQLFVQHYRKEYLYFN